MVEINGDVIMEILRKIQADTSQMKATLEDHSHQFIQLREDIHSLRGNDLRREIAHAQLSVRLDRIETRLELRDA